MSCFVTRVFGVGAISSPASGKPASTAEDGDGPFKRGMRDRGGVGTHSIAGLACGETMMGKMRPGIDSDEVPGRVSVCVVRAVSNYFQVAGLRLGVDCAATP